MNIVWCEYTICVNYNSYRAHISGQLRGECRLSRAAIIANGPTAAVKTHTVQLQINVNMTRNRFTDIKER